MRRLPFLAALAFALIGLAACGGSKGGGGSVHLSGKLAAAVSARALPATGSSAEALAADPDQILAIPMERGSLTAWNMQNSVSSQVAADGNFSFSLSEQYDWLLVLMSSTATGTDRFLGSVKVTTDTADTLLNLPITDAAVGDLDLGTVSQSAPAGDAVSGTAVAAASFDLTAIQLETLAKTDDLFRNAMNIVNNYGNFGNAAGVWYQLRPDFSWSGGSNEYATLDTTYSNPDMTYQGMNFQLDSNNSSVTMSQICDQSVLLELVPPADISTEMDTYGPSHPFSNTGVHCQPLNDHTETTGSAFYACDAYENISYSFEGTFAENPPGYWEWRIDGTTRAMFDVSSVNPPVTSAGKVRGFVPSFKINVDASNMIQSVDVKWYYFDETHSAYVELAPADLPVLKHFIRDAEVKLDRTYNGARQTDELYFDPATTSQVIPTKQWCFKECADPAQETGLMGFYESGGFGYYFNFWNPAISP